MPMSAKIFIKDSGARIRKGHPWVYGNQVLRTEGRAMPGDVVQVVDVAHGPLGQGYFNPASLIRVRLLTTHMDERVDASFIHKRIARAWATRQGMGYREHCRVVFGEADGLPALVVDKFGDVLALQTLALGMERWKDDIVAALREEIAPRGIYERNDVPIRSKEGLELRKGFIGDPFETRIMVEENGLRFHADVATGQKTGHFLDQVLNHDAMKLIASGRTALDCFTHTGGFALHLARYGAADVLGVDISAEAVAMAAANADLNDLAGVCRFQEANVFDLLNQASRDGRKWDVVVLDPPAFAKSRAALEGAYRGYKEINLRAMKCLPDGGYLVTCSCSQHMTNELFRQMVAEAALDAGKRLREVYYGTQPPDHPILWGMPETHYLKCLVLEVF